MKIVNHIAPTVQAKEECREVLSGLDIGSCFRFADGISFEQAKKTYGQSFFFITASNGAKPADDRVTCLSMDFMSHRILDKDCLVIKHDVNAAIVPAKMVDIKPVEFIENISDKA